MTWWRLFEVKYSNLLWLFVRILSFPAVLFVCFHFLPPGPACKCELRKWFQMQTSAKPGKKNKLLQGVGNKHVPGPQSLGGLARVSRYLPKSLSKDLVGSGVLLGTGVSCHGTDAKSSYYPCSSSKRWCPQNIQFLFNGKWLLQCFVANQASKTLVLIHLGSYAHTISHCCRALGVVVVMFGRERVRKICSNGFTSFIFPEDPGTLVWNGVEQSHVNQVGRALPWHSAEAWPTIQLVV